MFHFEAGIADGGDPYFYGDGIGIGEGDDELAVGMGEDGTDVAGFFDFHGLDGIEIGDSCAFEVAEVHDVVDVVERVHVAPGDGDFDRDVHLVFGFSLFEPQRHGDFIEVSQSFFSL